MKNNKLKSFAKFLLLFLILVILYSRFLEPTFLIVKEYPVINSKIEDNFHGLKIVHFSDLHYNDTTQIKELKNIVKEINKLNPHIVFFTGDLIDKGFKLTKEQEEEFIKELKKIKPSIDSYLVKGNHDYNEVYDKIIDETSFQILKNESREFYFNDIKPITIIGLESKLEKKLDIEKAFENHNPDNYTILLMHEPDIIKEIDTKKVDLILAGHSHNGQVRFPFVGSVFKLDGAKTYYDPKYIINNTEVYISGGLGTSKYQFRLLNPPSFNFYRLYNN